MPPSVEQVFQFLKEASEEARSGPPGNTRYILEHGSRKEIQDHLKEKFDYDARDIPERPTPPSRDACWALLAIAKLEYGPAEEAPESLQALMRAEGHAMPLAVTGEDEVAAAG